jgi:hypothetical protein
MSAFGGKADIAHGHDGDAPCRKTLWIKGKGGCGGAQPPLPNCLTLSAAPDLSCHKEYLAFARDHFRLLGIADIGSCLLYPQKRTLVERVAMSAKCQKRTSFSTPTHPLSAKGRPSAPPSATGKPPCDGSDSPNRLRIQEHIAGETRPHWPRKLREDTTRSSILHCLYRSSGSMV